MDTQQMPLSNNIQGALSGFGLDMLEAFMREPAELASIVPAAPLIPAPATYLAELAAHRDDVPKRLPEPAEPVADDWDF